MEKVKLEQVQDTWLTGRLGGCRRRTLRTRAMPSACRRQQQTQRSSRRSASSSEVPARLAAWQPRLRDWLSTVATTCLLVDPSSPLAPECSLLQRCKASAGIHAVRRQRCSTPPASGTCLCPGIAPRAVLSPFLWPTWAARAPPASSSHRQTLPRQRWCSAARARRSADHAAASAACCPESLKVRAVPVATVDLVGQSPPRPPAHLATLRAACRNCASGGG